MNPGLTDREKKVLALIQHAPEVSLKRLARAARFKVSALQYTLRSLEQRDILRETLPFINPYMLGFTDYQIYFSLTTGSRKTHAAVTNYFIQTDPVAWFSELSGEYQYGAIFCERRVEEVAQFLSDLVAKFGNIFAQKSFSTCLNFTSLGRRYLVAEKIEVPPYSRSLTAAAYRIDQDDHKILSHISSRPWISIRETANQLSMNFSTVRRRLLALEQAGVIPGFLRRVNLSNLGISRYRIVLEAHGHSAELTSRLYRFAQGQRHVNHFIECLGAWDYEIGLEVYNAAELREVIQQIYAEFGDVIGRLSSVEILQHLKYSGYPRYKLNA